LNAGSAKEQQGFSQLQQNSPNQLGSSNSTKWIMQTMLFGVACLITSLLKTDTSIQSS